MVQVNNPRMTLVNPAAERDVRESTLASGLGTIEGATVAVVNAFNDTERVHADLLVDRLGEHLKKEGVAEILTFRKKVSTQDMTVEMLEQICTHAQGVVILEGD
jgi:hypothetical protein